MENRFRPGFQRQRRDSLRDPLLSRCALDPDELASEVSR